MRYPEYRPRRSRKHAAMREFVRETRLSKASLIMPFFVAEGIRHKEPIKTMPGQFRFSGEELLSEADKLLKLGLKALLLFGIPRDKDVKASQAYSRSGIVQRSIRALKKRFPELIVIADTCLCEYMSHGHCGIVKKNGRSFTVQNDPSVELIARTALSQAEAGADIVAPSDMMDGRVQAIRKTLDKGGFQEVSILSYAAKFSSVFYGPFREAAGSAPHFGDRKSYQMDGANREEALREIALDIDEGADCVMVKPALAYLDIIREAKDRFAFPLAAYNVSGEYAFVKWAAKEGWDERGLVNEILTSIKRAGADWIFTYHALEAARWLE